MTFSRELKVGIFLLVGLIISGVVVFVIGDQQHMFESHVTFRTAFNDVEGLAEGATVRMNGINVGSVSAVGHADNLNDPRIHVEFWVVKSEARRVRVDASARIINKGLLGDKALELTPGSIGKPPLDEGGFMTSQPSPDITGLTSRVGSIATQADAVMGNLRKISETVASEQTQQDLQGTLRSMNVILQHVAEGEGYAHRLLADPEEAERLSRTISSLDRTSAELAVTSREFRELMGRINRGPGFVHDLIYDRQGSQSLAQVGRAADEVATTLKDVREGNGLAKGLLYGGDEQTGELVQNLTAASKDLRDIMGGLKSGKGTLGAMLVDPSVYEDLKVILGNVQRNTVLRALVRYSIRKDEQPPQVQINEPEP